jgi:hypothetical protein
MKKKYLNRFLVIIVIVLFLVISGCVTSAPRTTKPVTSSEQKTDVYVTNTQSPTMVYSTESKTPIIALSAEGKGNDIIVTYLGGPDDKFLKQIIIRIGDNPEVIYDNPQINQEYIFKNQNSPFMENVVGIGLFKSGRQQVILDTYV